MNWFRTTLLLAGLTALLLIVGQLIGGHTGLIIALLFALVMNFSAYWYSDKIVLASYGAQPVTANEAPELHSIVKDLARRANLPMPKVYIVNDPNPNAFATGRNPSHAAVAVTTGILQILDRDELMGVLGHELSHVRHRDTLTSTIAATIAGAISMLANIFSWMMIFGGGRDDDGPGVLGGLAMVILAPIAAALIQMAISRSREYAADEAGAKLCGKPLALASALQKLETVGKQVPLQNAESHPTTAHLFIINPLSGDMLKHLFSTHPPTEERIRRLKAMA